MGRCLTLRPSLNVFEVKKEAVITQGEVGVFFGYILPLWTAHEELFLSQIAPGRWNEVSDIGIHMYVALGGAEDVGDRFQLRISWEHAPETGVLPNTLHDVDVETTVLAGRAAMNDIYKVVFILDYDIDGGGNEVKPHELIGMRLRRIAATVNEVANDVMIVDWHDHWCVDKMFAPFLFG